MRSEVIDSKQKRKVHTSILNRYVTNLLGRKGSTTRAQETGSSCFRYTTNPRQLPSGIFQYSTHNHATLEHLGQPLFHTDGSHMSAIAAVAVGSCHDEVLLRVSESVVCPVLNNCDGSNRALRKSISGINCRINGEG
jgi:hypothetical protein